MITTKIHPINTFSALPDRHTSVEVLRGLAAQRNEYEERLGWPVSMDVRHSQLVMMTTQIADIVTMPAELGTLVLAELRIAMLTGPVSTDPDNQRWTFFTSPAQQMHDDLIDELSSYNIECPPPRHYVVVPTILTNSPNSQPWIVPPTPNHPLPPWHEVVATARRIEHHRDHRNSLPLLKAA